MFERELMISGLRRQHGLLHELIGELEARNRFDDHDLDLYEERTKYIQKNLKKLRKLKRDYFDFLYQ